ncbi:MAG: glycosyltransferase family 4 protein, partial [Gaiellaceae bacterium MAG52_C11]|nr:glycosyltransferase family 4 protein [Candidatus Gaiellasilicea maunaloa]
MTDRTIPARVLVVVENLSVPTDRRVWKEAQALTRQGYSVTIVCPAGTTRDRAAHERLEGVEIHRYPAREAGGEPWGYLREFGWALWQIRRLARRLAGEQPFDVVQLCNPPDVLYLAVLSLRRRGARIVFDHHDLVPELYEARFGGRSGVLYRLARRAERRTMRRADVVLSPNETYKSVAIERGGKDPRDVFVVRMAPDLDRFRAVAADASLRRGKPYLIGYAGTIGPQDGVDHALRALKLLADRRGDWHAIFAGTGDAADDARSLATELGLADRVEFVGFVEDAELIRLLSSADVCLAPEPRNALNEASTMIKVVEYMGLGRPIVA